MTENVNLLVFILLVVIIVQVSGLLNKICQPSLLDELFAGMLIALLGFF